MENAEDEGMDVKLIDYEEGFKYFDVTETPNKPWEYGVNQEFTADCDVMKEILTWMQTKMLEKV